MTPPSLLDDLALWSATTSAADQAVTAMVWTATVLAGYLAVTTAVYAVALVARAPGAVGHLERCTPAVGRRVAERVAALVLVGSTWSGGPAAMAAATAPLPPALEAPVSEVVVPAPEVAPPRSGPHPPAAARGAVGSVTVQPGDHLWGIAERTLAAGRSAAVPPAEVAPYWREVVALNRAHLRSGDPDLIHPGETVHLPPTDTAAGGR